MPFSLSSPKLAWPLQDDEELNEIERELLNRPIFVIGGAGRAAQRRQPQPPGWWTVPEASGLARPRRGAGVSVFCGRESLFAAPCYVSSAMDEHGSSCAGPWLVDEFDVRA